MNTSTHTVKRVSPMLAVADMKETIRFYTEVLQFSVRMESESYSIVESGEATIHLMLATDEKVLECVRGHTEVYIEVKGIESLWDHAKEYKGKFRMRDLFDREYGMREFHVSDPNGCLVFVGQQSEKA